MQGGNEDLNLYKNCQYSNCDIDNIHDVLDAYQKITSMFKGYLNKYQIYKILTHIRDQSHMKESLS